MSLSEINKLGARKYFEDRGVYRNPYAAGSPEGNEFERGWMQSLKKNGGRLVKESELQAEKLVKQATSDDMIKRYREIKG
ncbi:hypothetical protein [Viridibacterium curvum]|uniref:Uncharacterized protein n=1 Tax=Viridibacterium curvum TaxID=1101404 RepID=A0ABP9R731_9RHOO